MLHKPKVRLVVQSAESPYNIYYPTVVSATATFAYPFSVPTANIVIITNRTPETSGYVSPLRVDDILRLQVSVTYSRSEKMVWADIFEGRILTISSPFGQTNTTTLDCVGHIYETTYTLIEKSYNFTSSIDAVSMIDYICNTDGYLNRLTYTKDSAKTHYGAIATDYTTKKDQRYFHDILIDLEKIGQHGFYTDVKTVYNNSNNTLTTAFLCWLSFSTVPTEKYKVIEGTHRLIEANFSSTSEEMWNSVRVYGDTYQQSNGATPPVMIDKQYSGISYDTAYINQYGRRMKVETVTGITANTSCAQLANGLLQVSKNPFVIGEVTIFGTSYAKVGDLVYVKIPSLEIDGASINGNYRVVSVTHSVTENTFTTKLAFGKLKSEVSDYIATIKRQTRVNNCNHIKTPFV